MGILQTEKFTKHIKRIKINQNLVENFDFFHFKSIFDVFGIDSALKTIWKISQIDRPTRSCLSGKDGRCVG